VRENQNHGWKGGPPAVPVRCVSSKARAPSVKAGRIGEI